MAGPVPIPEGGWTDEEISVAVGMLKDELAAHDARIKKLETAAPPSGGTSLSPALMPAAGMFASLDSAPDNVKAAAKTVSDYIMSLTTAPT